MVQICSNGTSSAVFVPSILEQFHSPFLPTKEGLVIHCFLKTVELKL